MNRLTGVVSASGVAHRINPLLNGVAAAFRMGEDEAARFAAHPVARLIAAIPFLAGCSRPERTAAEHLGTYVLSVRETRSLFFAAPDDDGSVYDRLRPIMRFEDGDERIIRRGMATLALNMVHDYARDVAVDRIIGKHNPVGTGAWDGDAMIAGLRAEIAAHECPAMDEIMDSESDTDGYWRW